MKIIAFVEEIDVNKNGKISFDELFSHYKKINGVEGITDDIKNESPSSLLIKTEV